eukprot:Selendium_serpulae@DN6387_c0_g2_i1.p2
MFMGRIGAKSAAFINHKPFHPGNLQNLEKVWTAEENHKRELKKQAEFLERRNQEQQIEELRRALRKEEGAFGANVGEAGLGSKGGSHGATAASARKLQRRKATITRSADTKSKPPSSEDISGIVSSLYCEGNLEAGHTSVWGSFYDRDSQSWGYACCKQLKKGKECQRKQATAVSRETVKRKERDELRTISDASDKSKKSESEQPEKKKSKKERKRDPLKVDSGLASILQQLQDDEEV